MLLPARCGVKRESLSGARGGIAVDKACRVSKDCGGVFFDANSAGAGDFMFIHMFAFRFKSGVTTDQKNHIVSEIRKLKDGIPELQEAYVGLNVSPRAQGYELGGSMKFADAAAFERYNAHPVHQKLLSWLVPLVEPIEVDFPL
jgi:hypothetical protein